jgi:hypothetical protein
LMKPHFFLWYVCAYHEPMEFFLKILLEPLEFKSHDRDMGCSLVSVLGVKFT